MKRHLFLCITGIMVNVLAFGQTELGIHKESSSDWYPLSKIKEIRFLDNDLSVLTDSKEVFYSLSEVKNINFNIKGLTGIDNPSKEISGLSLKGNILSCTNNDKILVFDILGRKICSFEGSGDISFLKPGIYTAISNGQALKFFKK